jgi:hypothetical protein
VQSFNCESCALSLTALQQPTAFRLATHTISDVFNDEHLITQLGSYSEERQSNSCDPQESPSSDDHVGQTSLLFLVIDAAADYYSSNKTLMSSPPDVKVDIILDPYLLGVLPRSLAPTVAYIMCVAFVAYYLSGYIYAWIRRPAMTKKNTEKKSKVS